MRRNAGTKRAQPSFYRFKLGTNRDHPSSATADSRYPAVNAVGRSGRGRARKKPAQSTFQTPARVGLGNQHHPSVKRRQAGVDRRRLRPPNKFQENEWRLPRQSRSRGYAPGDIDTILFHSRQNFDQHWGHQ